MARPAHRSRLLCLSLAATALGGCTSVPVIWPLSAAPGGVPGYPSAIPSMLPAGARNCNDDGTTTVRNAQGFYSPPDALFCAQTYAVKIARKFFTEERSVEATQNGETLALGGIGTAAGIEAVLTKAASPVRTLGLAAAGIAGLDGVLGLKGQRESYQAAAISVACLIRLDAALDAAQSVASTPKGANPSDQMQADTMVMHALFAAMPEAAGPAAQPSDAALLSAMGAESGLRAMIASEDAGTADHALIAATQQTTDKLTRARNLQNGVQQVETSLASALSSSDITQIYAQARQGFSDLAGPVAITQKAAAQAAAKVDKPALAQAAAAATMMAASAPKAAMSAGMKAAAQSMTATVDKTASDANVTQQVATVYDACNGQATTKPDPKMPAQGASAPATGITSPAR